MVDQHRNGITNSSEPLGTHTSGTPVIGVLPASPACDPGPSSDGGPTPQAGFADRTPITGEPMVCVPRGPEEFVRPYSDAYPPPASEDFVLLCVGSAGAVANRGCRSTMVLRTEEHECAFRPDGGRIPTVAYLRADNTPRFAHGMCIGKLESVLACGLVALLSHASHQGMSRFAPRNVQVTSTLAHAPKKTPRTSHFLRCFLFGVQEHLAAHRVAYCFDHRAILLLRKLCLHRLCCLLHNTFIAYMACCMSLS